MPAHSAERIVFLSCKSAIYLLLGLVTALFIWSAFRLTTLENYTHISPLELTATLHAPPEEFSRVPFASPSGRSTLALDLNTIRLDESWEPLLPFAQRKQLEVFAATLKPAQQEAFLKNLKFLLADPGIANQEPEQLLDTYIALKQQRYHHPPEIAGLPAKIVLPVLLALSSLLLIFLFLCVVLLKVEHNTRGPSA